LVSMSPLVPAPLAVQVVAIGLQLPALATPQVPGAAAGQAPSGQSTGSAQGFPSLVPPWQTYSQSPTVVHACPSFGPPEQVEAVGQSAALVQVWPLAEPPLHALSLGQSATVAQALPLFGPPPHTVEPTKAGQNEV